MNKQKNTIDYTLTRGVEQVIPSKKALSLFMQKNKLTLYQGFDPTSNNLHLGHMVAFRKLSQFQKLGHRVIFLIGDGTGQAGDPTGKKRTRESFFTREELLNNARNYKEVAGKFLDFSGLNPAKMLFNSAWLNELKLLDILNIAENFSVQQLIERDMFQDRLKNSAPINLREFLYPLLQGYDSVAMNVDLEIGGSDQLFNMMTGRVLMKNIRNKEKFVLTTKLLEDPNGRKMGKSEGNAINLMDKPNDIFGKVMALPDEMMISAAEILTDLPLDFAIGLETINAKKKLAHEIVAEIYSKEEADNALLYFENTFQKRSVPTSMETIKVSFTSLSSIALLTKTGVIESNSEAKRLLKQKAIDIDGEVVSDGQKEIKIKKEGIVVKIGKRKYYKIVKYNEVED